MKYLTNITLGHILSILEAIPRACCCAIDHKGSCLRFWKYYLTSVHANLICLLKVLFSNSRNTSLVLVHVCWNVFFSERQLEEEFCFLFFFLSMFDGWINYFILFYFFYKVYWDCFFWQATVHVGKNKHYTGYAITVYSPLCFLTLLFIKRNKSA